MSITALPQPSRRTSLLKGTAVNAVLAEVRQLQAQGREIVSLLRGEPDFPTPPHIVEAAVAALRSGRTRYPDNRGELHLREAIAAALHRAHGITCDPAAEVLVTTGATLGIQIALLALIDEGDEVLVPDPVYDAYTSPIHLAGGRIRPVRGELRDGRFHLTADAVEGAWTPACRVLLLNTPWNPTGTVFTIDELRALAAVAARRGLFIVSDEIYEAITYAGHRHVSPASLDPETRARTVIVNSLSKTYAMTGWRVGYCVAPEWLVRAMFLVLQQTSRGPATFVQDAAAAAVAGPQACVVEMAAEYARRRARVADALRGAASARVLLPEGGFFAMLDVRDSGRPSDEIRRQLLREHSVAVVHGAAYGPGGEGTLRVSFGSGGEVLDRGLAQLRRGLDAL